MRRSIVQKREYGCGVACFAFAANMSYRGAEEHLGPRIVSSHEFRGVLMNRLLNELGLKYRKQYAGSGWRPKKYRDGTIAYIYSDPIYPHGHYFIRHKGAWMDPWINVRHDRRIRYAQSGYRKRLPGKPMFFLLPAL